MTRPILALLVGLALGCAVPVSSRIRELDPMPTLRKLVILPFAADPVRGGAVEDDATAVVATRMVEALTQDTDLEIVPPEEAVRARGQAGEASGAELRRLFGSDAILSGVVRRYIERSGGPGGSSRPASVWFSLELRTPEGELLWSGTYDETQRGLSEDLGSLGRAWQRGFRFVTAADLAGYGAHQLVRSLEADYGPWS